MKQLDLFDSFQLIQSDFEDAEKELEKAKERYTSAKKLRDDNCPHLQLKSMKYYTPKSYCDSANTEYWDECVCCGAEFNHTIQYYD